MAVPWLDGARAPWWRDDARAGFVGLGRPTGPATWRAPSWKRSPGTCCASWRSSRSGDWGSPAEGVTLGGAGSGLPVWVEVLTSVLGVSAVRHRSGEAASAGAALLAGRALGMGLTLEQLDPVEEVIEPDPSSVDVYRGLRPMVDHVAESVIAATDALPVAGRAPRRNGGPARVPRRIPCGTHPCPEAPGTSAQAGRSVGSAPEPDTHVRDRVPPMPDAPVFDFAVPDDLLKEAVAQVKDTDVVADLEVMPGTGEGKPPPLAGILQPVGLRRRWCC